MKAISTDKAPHVVGPYSQAIVASGFIFCAGQIGLNPVTGEMEEGVEKQTTQVMANIKAVLAAAGSSIEDVVKTTIFVQHMEDYQTVNHVYEKELGNNKPARSTVEVAKLPKNALVEIEAIATLK